MASGNVLSACFIHFIGAAICLSSLLSTACAIGGNETDRLALLEIKSKITDDPFGILSFWNDSVNFCQWHGVTCGRKHQRVTQLELGSLKLGGTISPHVGNLSFLRVLSLFNNSFRDEIPPGIGRLRRLRLLDLRNNSLSGEIPSNVSGCIELLALRFGGNQLVGDIPTEIGSLSKLEILEGYKNNITGSIPASIGNLSSLTVLSFGGNQLGGTIPCSLGQIRNLHSLDLTSNQISGVVPAPIFNLSFIAFMQMGLNDLEGYLPPNLFISLPNIQDFSVPSNRFHGSIPSSVSNASNLEFLQLQSNQLAGEVPNLERLNKLNFLTLDLNYLGNGGFRGLNFVCSLINATTLESLTISANNFGGTLPKCIGKLSSKLRRLWFAKNQISGSLPSGIGNLVNLEELKGWSNKFSGIIPQTIGNLKNLQLLDLMENKFSGKIPSSLGNLTKLIQLILGNNSFQGVIPSSLGDCKILEVLELSFNNLSGAIPPEVLKNLPSHLVFLLLSHNHLSGPIPIEIGNLMSLDELDVSNNRLSGEIPRDLSSCASLEYLHMQGNLFNGSIPSSLASLRGLQVLDLSANNLSGQIPEIFTSFQSLLDLDLSFNELEGRVPIEGVFKNASATSVLGNKKLCGGIPEFQLPVCNLQKHGNRKLSIKLKIIIGTMSGFSGVSLLLSLIFIQCLKNKRQKHNASSLENEILKVSYWDLHKATNGFLEENLIGVGSFGSVYKGALGADGSLIAIKVINLQHDQASKSFVAECEALRNIRHRNLVKVLTACSSVDNQGNDFKALIYEFMSNGSLEEWLHFPLQEEATSQVQKFLTLNQRLSIAIDVASALEYLHYRCDSTIVHCDLKPSNILLDDELIGHVSDFGLVKFLSKGIQNCPPNQSSSLGLKGTIGYAPPEYGMGSEISTSGDVYSFGITLLEMFTRKRPTNDMFTDGWNLHKLAEHSLSNGVAKIIDPTLLEEIGESERATNDSFQFRTTRDRDNGTIKCLMSIVEIGVACSTESPEERMNICEVTTRLCSISDKLNKVRHGRTALHQEDP